MTPNQVPPAQEGPQGETEQTVEHVFAAMLGVPSLPRTASIFDLGLDSVSVTLASAQLEQATGVRIRFTQLFRTPTVAQLGAWIDAARDGNHGSSEPAGLADSRVSELVAITPMQADTVPTSIAVEIAWCFDGEIDEAALEAAVTDIHHRHQALHARYLTGSELGLAEVPADPGRPEFHRLGRRDTDSASTGALGAVLREPLRLAEGVVWRCATVHSAESGRLLFGMTVHHAAFDGRSWDIMTAELPTAYAARKAGKAPQWSGRVASLAEMAADFRHQLADADIDVQRRYWRDELRDMPACDFPRRSDAPAAPDAGDARWSAPGPAAARSFLVSNAQLRSWESHARERGMPASVGVAAAFVQAVVRSNGSPDFGVMVSIANRAGEVIDRTITNRVGNIVLRPNGPAQSGRDILARAHDSYHHAMAARDVLVDPQELGGVLSGEDSDRAIHLDRLASVTYNSSPQLDLDGAVGTIADDEAGETTCMFAVMLHVVPVPDGLAVDILVRTDLYDASLAEHLGTAFTDIIDHGPAQLARDTERAASR